MELPPWTPNGSNDLLVTALADTSGRFIKMSSFTIRYVAIPVAVLLAVGLMTLLGLPALNDLYNAMVAGIKKLLYQDAKT